jgi:OOP family OmpA-OmpF porin
MLTLRREKMKKISPLLLLLLIISVDVTKAQLAKDSWAFGFGFKYPRFFSINVTPLNTNYGGYISVTRNFSEHFGIRLETGYSHLAYEYPSAVTGITASNTNVISGDLDLIYNLVPCEFISPYFFAGVGGIYRMLNVNRFTNALNDNAFGFQMNGGGGLEINLDARWKLSAEYGYHITNNSEIDGCVVATELNGRDTYMSISIGLIYLFDKGDQSKYCQLYSGITQDQKDMTDYNKIEAMIIKHIPKEVVKEVVVEKTSKVAAEKWVLIGVNFDFSSTKLSAESYPILYDALKTLLKNPDMRVEIQGYTDNIGSESYNKKLAQKRADLVKDYFISKNISADRLTAVGYGENNPVADNKTAEGRALNRRIEFKVQ